MPFIPYVTTSVLMLMLPWPLLAVGLFMGIGADRRPRLMKRMTLGASWFALGCAGLIAGTYFGGKATSTPVMAVHLPAKLGELAISVDVNGLTVLMLGLVAFVGTFVARYASPYLEGDVHEGQFHRWLSLTLGFFLMMIVSDNLWAFLLFWIATSLGLHQLLAFYRERPVAVLAARKKFLLHRIADVSLLAALVLIVRTLHTSQFAGMAPALAAISGPLPISLQLASGFLILSAALKSAQFPFHGWLIQVMEAPTPVSALLHAGLIYTGAFLLLRTASLLDRVPWADNALIGIGLVSLAAASLMMLTATNMKGSLAYSTAAQMGFMLMECGLGLYSLALLHIVSHAVYKAHAFLSSGSVVDHFRFPVIPAMPRVATMGPAIGSLLVAIPVVLGTGLVLGIPLFQQKPLIVMDIILTVAVSQLVLQALNTEKLGGGRFLWTLIGLSTLISTAYFSLDILFTTLFGAMWPPLPGPDGVVRDSLLGLIVGTFVGLLVVQQVWPRILRHPFWQAVYVHLYNDLYIDLWLTRWIRQLGPGAVVSRLPAPHEDHLQEVIS